LRGMPCGKKGGVMKLEMKRLCLAFANLPAPDLEFVFRESAEEFVDALLCVPQVVRELLADTPETRITLERVETYDRILSTLADDGDEYGGEAGQLRKAKREAAVELARAVVGTEAKNAPRLADQEAAAS
jgi:hypothetical protein